MSFSAVRGCIIRNPICRRIGRGFWQLSRDLPRRIPLQKFRTLRRWSGRPAGWHLTVADYLAVHPGRGWQKLVGESGSYERVSPITAGSRLPACFDPPQTVTWEEERVIYLEGCRYWGEYGGAVIAHDELLIGELSPDVWGVERHAIFNKVKLPPICPLPGLTAVISTPEANVNYSHWLMDLLPRLNLLERAGFGPSIVDRYLINLGGGHYERETLALAGIPFDKVKYVSDASHFACERIVSTNLRSKHWQHSLPGWVPNYLRGLAGPPDFQSASSHRLYLTRESASFRRVLNEKELLPTLERHGFEIVDPARLSVREQARLFSRSEVIVSPHSSAMTNLVFCRPGTAVLEIFPADYFDVSFWTAATMAGSRYYATMGERSGLRAPQTYIEGRRQDVLIRPEALNDAICQILNGTDNSPGKSVPRCGSLEAT